MKHLLPALLLAFCSATPAWAATNANNGQPALPQFITVKANSNVALVYFPLSDRGGTPPACAVSIGGTYFRYAFDISTVNGRSMLALLLADNTAGISVGFGGGGTCNVDGSDEDLASVQTQ